MRAGVFLALPMETSKLTRHIDSERAHIETPIESHPPAMRQFGCCNDVMMN